MRPATSTAQLAITGLCVAMLFACTTEETPERSQNELDAQSALDRDAPDAEVQRAQDTPVLFLSE